MNKELDLIPNISYSYKLLFSFYDNYRNKQIYNEIKTVVLGLKQIEDETDNEILICYQMYLLIFSRGYNAEFIVYYKEYLKINPNTMSNNIENLEDIFNFSKKDAFLSIVKLQKLLDTKDIYFCFFVFLIMVRIINKHLSTLIVLPKNFHNECSNYHDESILKYFIMGWLSDFKIKGLRNLKKIIMTKYIDDKDIMLKNGIENIYLFGSIMTNAYHRESDIDLVIKFEKNIDFIKKKEIVKNIKKYNLDNFGRSTDIQEYFDFKEFHPNLEIEKII